jgi:hypothetical protein
MDQYMFSIGFMTGMMYLWFTSYPRTVVHNVIHVKVEILDQENFDVEKFGRVISDIEGLA